MSENPETGLPSTKAGAPFDPKNPFRESDTAARARRRRSMVLGLGLVVFVILIFVVTLVKLKGNVLAGSHL